MTDLTPPSRPGPAVPSGESVAPGSPDSAAAAVSPAHTGVASAVADAVERRWMIVCGVVLAVQALRALLYPFLTTGEDLGPDGLNYWHQALIYAAGRWPWTDAGTHWPPLYPLVVGLLMKLTGTTLLVPRALNALAWVACVGLTGTLGAMTAGPVAGALAAATFALDDPFFYIKFVQYELLLVALGTASLVLALAVIDTARRPASALGAGAVAGLAAFAHSKLLPLSAVLAAAIALLAGEDRRARLRLALAYILGVAVALLPWTVRNAQVAHRLVLVSSNGPRTFLWGNNRYATGMMIVPGDIDAVEGTGTEDEQHARMMEHGERFIREHTGYWLTTVVPRKLWHFLDFGATLRAHVILWLALLGLAWGALTGRLAHPFLLAATPAMLLCFSLLFHGEGRYRYPGLPMTHVFAAVALLGLAQRAGLPDRPPHAAPLAGARRAFLVVSLALLGAILGRAYAVSPPQLVAAEIWWQSDGRLHLRAWANDASPLLATLSFSRDPSETRTGQLVMDDQGHHHAAWTPPVTPGDYTLLLSWPARPPAATLHFTWEAPSVHQSLTPPAAAPALTAAPAPTAPVVLARWSLIPPSGDGR